MMDPYGGFCGYVVRWQIRALATLVKDFYNVIFHPQRTKIEIKISPFKHAFFLHSFWCKSFNSATYPPFSLGCAACSPLRPDFGIFLLPKWSRHLYNCSRGRKGRNPVLVSFQFHLYSAKAFLPMKETNCECEIFYLKSWCDAIALFEYKVFMLNHAFNQRR